jgi:hypothetical protein
LILSCDKEVGNDLLAHYTCAPLVAALPPLEGGYGG